MNNGKRRSFIKKSSMLPFTALLSTGLTNASHCTGNATITCASNCVTAKRCCTHPESNTKQVYKCTYNGSDIGYCDVNDNEEYTDSNGKTKKFKNSCP